LKSRLLEAMEHGARVISIAWEISGWMLFLNASLSQSGKLGYYVYSKSNSTQ